MTTMRDVAEHAGVSIATVSFVINNTKPVTQATRARIEASMEALGYRPQLVVVEFNGTILPRQRWSEQPVVETDALEVVTIVGGGS